MDEANQLLAFMDGPLALHGVLPPAEPLGPGRCRRVICMRLGIPAGGFFAGCRRRGHRGLRNRSYRSHLEPARIVSPEGLRYRKRVLDEFLLDELRRYAEADGTLGACPS